MIAETWTPEVGAALVAAREGVYTRPAPSANSLLRIFLNE